MSKLRTYFSVLESFVLSLIISIAFAGFVFILLSETDRRELWISIAYLAVAGISLSLSLHYREKQSYSGTRSLANPLDILAIGLCIAFYIGFILLMYPNAAIMTGTDISRHFSNSVILSKSPDLYSAPYYILFHAFQGSTFSISGTDQPIDLFLSGFSILNLFLPLSVYVAAKRLLSGFDVRLPALSVIFYTVLSNLSYIYFTRLNLVRPENIGDEYLLVAREVAERSYFGIINFLQPFHFVVPLTISVIGMLFLLSLLKNESIPRTKFLVVFTTVTTIICLVHVPEAAIFTIILSVYSTLRGSKGLRIKDALESSIAAFVISGIVFALISFVFLKNIDTAFNLVTVLTFVVPTLITSASYIFVSRRHGLGLFADVWLERYLSKRMLQYCSIAIVSLYLVGYVLWFFVEDFRASEFNLVGVVPSFIFPMLLGVVGLLALFSIRFIGQRPFGDVILFLLIGMIVMFLFGKVLSYVSLNIQPLPYWEKRLPMLIFVFASILAPIIVVKMWDFMSEKRSKQFSTIVGIFVVAAIILTGFSSMATQVEYWYIRASGDKRLTDSEIDATNYLRGLSEKYGSVFTAAPSETSQHVLTFAAPPYHFSKPDILFTAKTPAVPLMILDSLPYDQAFIYMHDRDFESLERSPGSWVSRHLLPSLPLLYNNSEVKIYNATGLTQPVGESNTALVIPSKSFRDNWLYAYDILSRSGLNYTVMTEEDHTLLRDHNNIILGSDPVSEQTTHINFSTTDPPELDSWKIGGQWNIDQEGIHGNGNYTDRSRDRNMLISDIVSEDDKLTVSSLFRINDADPGGRTITYVSFVIPWTNQTRFDMAGIALQGNKISTYFSSIRGSETMSYPPYPYKDTGLVWEPGDVLNMTLVKNGEIEDIYLNGTKYLSRSLDIESAAGYIGLSTSRAKDILFKDLVVSGSNELLIPAEKYLNHVKSGSNLTVINTNGNGSLMKSLSSNKIQKAGEPNLACINGDESKKMIHEKKYFGEELNGILGTENSEIACSVQRIGEGYLKYIDIYKTLNSELIPEATKLKILTLIGTSMISGDAPLKTVLNFREVPLTFRDLLGEGKIIVSTNAAIFPKNENFTIVQYGFKNGSNTNNSGQTNSEDNNSLTLTNLKVNHIEMQDYRDAKVYLDRFLVANGHGLYLDAIVGKGDPISIVFDNESSTSLKVKIANDTSPVLLTGIASVTFKNGNGPVHLVMRQPVLSVDGSIEIKDLEAARLTGISDQDVELHGNLSTRILASDVYTMGDRPDLKNINFPSSERLNEFSLLLRSTFDFNLYSLPILVRVILAVPFVLAALFLFYRRIF